MSNPRVKIKRISIDTKYGDHFDEIEVLVDGHSMGTGHFGGEPEDNTKYRDYRWVEPMLVKLANSLGAEVEFEDVVMEND